MANTIRLKESALGMLTEIFDGVKNATRLGPDQPSREEDTRHSMRSEDRRNETNQTSEGVTRGEDAEEVLSSILPLEEHITNNEREKDKDVLNDYHSWILKQLKNEYKSRELPRPLPKNRKAYILALEEDDILRSEEAPNDGSGDAEENLELPSNNDLDDELYDLAGGNDSGSELALTGPGWKQSGKRPSIDSPKKLASAHPRVKKPRVHGNQQQTSEGHGAENDPLSLSENELLTLPPGSPFLSIQDMIQDFQGDTNDGWPFGDDDEQISH